MSLFPACEKDFALATAQGSLACTVHLPEVVPAPVLVCSHGLLSSRSSSKFAVMGEEFSRAGLAVVRFDFSGCGDSPAPLERCLLPVRLGNLRDVVKHALGQSWCNGRISLLGSSLGGYLSLLAAAEMRGLVRAVVCWATPFDLERIRRGLQDSDELKSHFPGGMQLGEPRNLAALPPVERVLILHGEKDETVPPQHAMEIYGRLGEPRSLCFFDDGDHRLLDPHCREVARQLSLDWLLEHGA